MQGARHIQPYLIDTELAYDVEELFKKYNYDLNLSFRREGLHKLYTNYFTPPKS